jgi:CDP-4-dehydro-6-deoxyglucose reductase
MAFEWKEAIIVNIIDETPTTKRFFFEVKDGSIFDFTPGQFITLDLPIHEKRNKRWRSYSIASYPNGTHQFELVIVLLEGGLGTTYLFNEVKVGDTVSFRGPQGVFILPKTLDKDLYLICTGTGVAPFRSMVHFIHQNKIPHQAINLIFGCRKFTDCLYEQELKQLEKAEPGFFYHPSFSRETEIREGAYNGYVHPVYQNLLAKSNKDNAQFFICGWKEMIDEARTKLAEQGIPKDRIHFELYG